jgi:hypothetical protein
MTFIELHVGVDRFLAAQRTYLRRLALCPPVLPSIGGVQLVVDRVDLEVSSLRHNENEQFDLFWMDGGERVPYFARADGKSTMLVQQLTVQLTTEAEIRSHPNADPPLTPWQATVVYALSADSLDTDCWLRARAVGVDLGPPPPLPVEVPPAVVGIVEDFLLTRFRTFAPSGAVPMGLDTLKLPVPFVNAGLSVDDTGQTLAIRVQLGGSGEPRVTAWSNFFGGFFVDRREGRDWALYVPGDYVTGTITSQLWQNLPQQDDLETYPGTTYSAQDGKAVLDIDVLLIYHVLESDALDLDVTVEADPHVTLRLWVQKDDTLRALIDFSGLVNPVGLLSTVAVAIIDVFQIPARQILYRLVGSAAVEALASAPVDSVTTPTSTTICIERNVVMPAVPGVVRVVMTDLLAQPDGIALAGSVSVTEPTNAVAAVAGVEQFRKQVPPISCGGASLALVALFSTNPAVFAVLHATATIANGGTAPLRLCQPPAVQRSDAPVQARNIRLEQGPPIVLTFDIGLPDPSYVDHPFPIDVMVRTNGGTRLLRLDPPPRITHDDLDRIEAELLVAIGNCEQLVDPWFKTHNGYNPRWSPRPAGDAVLRHLWQVTVSGLPAGEAVELHGTNRAMLVRAVSRGVDIPVRVAAVTVPSGENRELGIVRVSAAAPAEDRALPDGAPATRQGLAVRQTDLVVEGEIPLAHTCHRVAIVSLGDGPAVVALLAERAVAFDVLSAAPGAPLAVWDGGFAGVVRLPESTLFYGSGGAFLVDASGRMTATAIREPILDGARRPGGAVLVTHDRVLELTSRMELVAEFRRPGVTCAGVTGGRVVLGHAEGLMLSDAGVDGRLARGAVTSLGDASNLRRGALLATWADGHASLLATTGNALIEIATYWTAPSLAGAVRLGDHLTQITGSGDRLQLLRVGTTVTL